MYKQKIITAIQKQEWLRITFQRKKDNICVTRDIAPYDIFSQETGKHKGEDRLIGYTKTHEDYRPGVISLYLNEIINVVNTGERFDGHIIKRLINPKRPPYIPRDW